MAGKSQLQKAVEELTLVAYSTVPELRDAEVLVTVEGVGDVPHSFESAIKLRETLSKIKDSAEVQLKQINEQLLLSMRAGQIDKVKLWDGMKLEVRNGSSASKIEATKLLEHGVALEVIQAATTPGNPFQFVTVVKPKKVE